MICSDDFPLISSTQIDFLKSELSSVTYPTFLECFKMANPASFCLFPIFSIKNTWGAAVTQWICLHLPCCLPGFDSLARHLHFYQFKFEFKLWRWKDENKHNNGKHRPLLHYFRYFQSKIPIFTIKNGKKCPSSLDSHELHVTRAAVADGCNAAAEIGNFQFFSCTLLPQLHASNTACVN